MFIYYVEWGWETEGLCHFSPFWTTWIFYHKNANYKQTNKVDYIKYSSQFCALLKWIITDKDLKYRIHISLQNSLFRVTANIWEAPKPF